MSGLAMTTIEDAIQSWIVTGSGLASDHVIWAAQGAPRPVGEFIDMRLFVAMRGRDWLDRIDNIFTIATQAITAVSAGADTLTIPNHGIPSSGTGPITLTTTGTLPTANPPLALLTNYWPVVVDGNTIKLATTFQNAVAAVPVVIDLTGAGTGTTSINGTPTTTRAGQEVSQRARGPRPGQLQLQCFGGAPTGAGPTGASSPLSILHDAISAYALESVAFGLNAAKIGIGRIEPIRVFDGVVQSVRLEPRAMATVHLHLASELVETSTYIQIVNATDNIPTPAVALPPIILP